MDAMNERQTLRNLMTLTVGLLLGCEAGTSAMTHGIEGESATTITAGLGGGPGGDGGPFGHIGRLPFIITFHMETKTARVCDASGSECATASQWSDNMDALEGLVDLLSDAGLKGTFQHQIQWLERLDSSIQGRRITRKMITGGHEIGLHHHGASHPGWNGYTRDDELSDEPGYIGDMDDYMAIVHDWERTWGSDVTTIEGTDLNAGTEDALHQDEWVYRTGDDTSCTWAVSVADDEKACGLTSESGSTLGRPAWTVVVAPSSINDWSEITGYATLGHTYFGTANANSEACQQVYVNNLEDAIEGILCDPDRDSTDAVNVVLHPILDFALNDGVRSVYEAFFLNLGDDPRLVGMTVQEFMCERVGNCHDDE
jgi:hypothetical protein